MRKKNGGKKRQGSFFVGVINAFTAFVYSFFSNGRLGRVLESDGELYRESRFARFFEKSARSLRNDGNKYVERVMEHSTAIRAAGAFRSFLASLSLNVYGIFSVVYGLASVFMYYLSFALNGKNDHGTSAVVTAVILIVCALPMLVTARSAVSVVSESRVLRMLLLSFLGIPEEKLRSGRQIGGTEYMFMSSILALLCGIFTYFLHPAYIPMTVLVIVLICLVSSHPESGVVITVAVAPFLQFSNAPDVILLVLIVGTAISYFCKLARRRRTMSLSAETVVVILFCGFVLASAIFSHGGLQTLRESLTAIIVIFGGFYLTYSLMETENRLSACVRILVVSFISLSLAGIWNLFYNGIADGVIYSVRENVSPIFENNIIYIADSVSVFGVFAVLIAPLVFAYTTKQKTAKGISLSIILIAITFAATFIYGTYEAIFAIAIEFCLFWIIYSHRSMTVVILAAIPSLVGILAYPYFAKWLDLPQMNELVRNLLPLGFSDSSAHLSVCKTVIDMLKDGNLTGIGAGKHAFEAVYPAYSDAVSAGATNPGSLWLQVVCWSGLGGLLCFLVFALLLGKSGLGHLMRSREKSMRAETLALFCGVFMALVFGSVNCVWEDIRMLYLFWTCAGLLSAYVREGKEAADRKSAVFAYETDNTDIELRF